MPVGMRHSGFSGARVHGRNIGGDAVRTVDEYVTTALEERNGCRRRYLKTIDAHIAWHRDEIAKVVWQ